MERKDRAAYYIRDLSICIYRFVFVLSIDLNYQHVVILSHELMATRPSFFFYIDRSDIYLFNVNLAAAQATRARAWLFVPAEKPQLSPYEEDDPLKSFFKPSKV